MKNKAPQVKATREKRGWSQEKLAEEAKVGPRTIQRIESGEPVRMDTIRMVARALEVDPEQLIEEGEAPSPALAFFPRITGGKQLLDLISRNPSWWKGDYDCEPATREEFDLLETFFKTIETVDWGAGASSRVRAAFEFGEAIRLLEDGGFALFGGVEVEEFFDSEVGWRTNNNVTVLVRRITSQARERELVRRQEPPRPWGAK